MYKPLSGDGRDAVFVGPYLPALTGQEVSALPAVFIAAGVVVDVEETCHLDSLVERQDALLRPHLKSDGLFDADLAHVRRATGRMGIERHRVDALHVPGFAHVVEEDQVGVFPLVDGRLGRVGKRSTVAGERMNARFCALARLHRGLTLKDVGELVPVGAGYEDDPIPLVEEMFLNVLQHSGFPKRPYQLMVFGR